VRFLFSFTGGTGHFVPTVPFARALAARDHEVRYTCQEAMVPVVSAAGWEAVPSGGATLLDPCARRPLARLDRIAEGEVIRDVFAGKVARERAARLYDVIEDFGPDVIVRDEVDFGAAVVAEACHLPHAAVVVIAAGGFLTPELIREPLASLRSEYGLADDGLGMLHRYLTLVPVPASFRDPNDPLPSTAHHVQPAVLDEPDDAQPGTVVGRPTIYFTLGTIFHQESGDLFHRVLAGLAGLDADVVVTVGREIDPAELGLRPENVRIERFVPAEEVLSRCQLVVCHGGSGTVVGALAFGVPLILLPMGADQPLNADRCRALGVATVLDASTATAQTINEAAVAALKDSSARARALALRDETRALPRAAQAARRLERLAEANENESSDPRAGAR